MAQSRRPEGGRSSKPDPKRNATRRPVGPGAARSGPPTPASDLQRSVANRSMPVLVRLHRMPRWLLLILTAALLIAGLAIDGAVGGVLLLLLGCFLAWLLLLSWPLLPPVGRLVRTGVVALVLVVSFAKLLT